MPSWNVALQYWDPIYPDLSCQLFSMQGIAYPCRIVVYACDVSAAPMAKNTHAQIEADLNARTGTLVAPCFGPGLFSCQTWSQKKCLQVLVPVIGLPVSSQVRNDILHWQTKAGDIGLILPAILPSQNHVTVFASCPPSISGLNSIPWGGVPRTLASAVVQKALHDSQPGLFISYRREDASALVEQLYDELSHSGFRVFLDRFSMTSGRYFPQEIAEELTDKAVLLVVETSNILQSRWTVWEVGFAHVYHLGLLALNFGRAPRLSGIAQRHFVQRNSSGVLNGPDLEKTVEFVQREWNFAAVRRRAFYEGFIAKAVSAGGGTVKDRGDGLLTICNRYSGPSAIVSASGRPGSLGDIRSLADAIGKGQRLLLGQHLHIPQRAQDDLAWLAKMTSVELHGHYSGYQRVKSLC